MLTKIGDAYDVVIMGGGISGLSLALQLKQNAADLRIAVIEKAKHPVPESAHKVGESSVEIGSRYFQEILGLQHLLDHQLPKLGLRFFYSFGGNYDISKRVELGPSDFPPVPSFQLDRGRFENALGQECLQCGIDFCAETVIRSIELLGKNDHEISVVQHNKTHPIHAKWLVDASGRNGLLKRKLKLSKPVYHDMNAAWFRIRSEINIDHWSPCDQWTARVGNTRRLSTNHLLGTGYWVWLIPLASGSTSIGIVADPKYHPFIEFNTFAKAINWLIKYEPQCAAIIQGQSDLLQDFKTMKHYSHSCKQLYSTDGWCITGDSGVFVDPLYSPGNDFIAIGNSFITALVVKHHQGNPIDAEVPEYEKIFRSIHLAFIPIYEDQYSIMGNAKVMSVKIIWDYCIYWGSVALLFFRGKLCDYGFMESGWTFLREIYSLNVAMQRFFRAWAKVDFSAENTSEIFVDYTKMEFLRLLSQKLLEDLNDAELIEQLSRNVALAKELANEIIFEAISTAPELSTEAPGIQSSRSEYLNLMFDLFRVDDEKKRTRHTIISLNSNSSDRRT